MSAAKSSTIETMIIRVRDGEDVQNSLKTLATSTIPQDLVTKMDLEKLLTPLSKSLHLSGYIHEILKKLDGQKSKKTEKLAQKSVPKRKISIKKVLKVGGVKNPRRSSGANKKVVVESSEDPGDVKENQKTSGRLFKKKEPKKKDSSIWKKIKKNQD